jgi:two-component system cell cycle response regulator
VGDREIIMSAGFDGYITKPIEPKSFVQQVDAFLPMEKRGRGAVLGQATDAEERPVPQGRRLLVVDDQQVNLDLAQSILRGSGYQVTTASTMAEALRLARSVPPDLIMSDVCMADANGYDFIAAVKADPRLSSIPFVFVTSTMNTETEQRKGLALGAARFLFRPIEPTELLREIAACLGDAKER